MKNNKKSKKYPNKDVEIWTEEQYEEYLKGIYGIECIAGFTEGGLPYGLSEEESNDTDEIPF